MKVSAQYAEEHFADILHAADNGEEVEIARPHKPALFLATRPATVPFKRATPRVLGAGRGKMVVPTWEEWKAMDQQTEREMLDAPFITTGEI
jgi:antitoxin (DNA-binding transcriptional repressor) of toxin-antitoxin stability system